MRENIFSRIMNPSSRGKVWRTFILVLLLSAVAALFAFGPQYNAKKDRVKELTKGVITLPRMKEVPFRLGLDLLGGTRLIYEADITGIAENDRAQAVEGVRDVIERRVNSFGVSEPNVYRETTGDRYKVIVELAGIKDIKEAIKMIGETPLLEFKEQGAEKKELTADEKKQVENEAKQAEKKASEVLGKAMKGGDFEALAKQYNEDSATKDNSGDLGWITASDNPFAVNAIKNLKPGSITKDLVKGENAYAIYKLEDKRIKTDPFDAGKQEKEVKASHILITYEGSKAGESKMTKEAAYSRAKEILSKVNTSNFSTFAKDNSNEPGAKQSGGSLGYFARGAMVKPFEDAVFDAKVGIVPFVVETEFGYHVIYKEAERPIEEYKVRQIVFAFKTAEELFGDQSEWKKTELTGKYLKSAKVQFSQNSGFPEISLNFDDEGAKMFEEITGRNIGKPVAIFLDDQPISVPNVNDRISGGQAVITGQFNYKDAQLLAQRLNAGALPIKINLVNQQTVGATLGEKSINDSVRAGLYGFLLVALFMIIFYRLPGIMSVVALAIYTVLSLALFKSVSVTITLSGIAGFIMSLGVAVDANVLIFSRLREELAKGHPLSKALEDSFVRSWPSIRDSNFSTLITCLVLIFFSTSVVKGFAITLMIGVLMSMFTAIFMTRNFLRLIPGQWFEKMPWLIGYSKK